MDIDTLIPRLMSIIARESERDGVDPDRLATLCAQAAVRESGRQVGLFEALATAFAHGQSKPHLVQRVVDAIRSFADCDAAAARLAGDDFFDHRGATDPEGMADNSLKTSTSRDTEGDGFGSQACPAAIVSGRLGNRLETLGLPSSSEFDSLFVPDLEQCSTRIASRLDDLNLSQQHFGADFRSFILVPMHKAERTVGLILLADHRPQYFSAADLAALEKVAALVTDAILENLSQHDQHVAKVNEIQRLRVEGLGDLASGIAHDFNNILMGISATAEVAVAQRSDPERIDKLMARILESVDRGSETVRQMLAFGVRDLPEADTVDLTKLVELWMRYQIETWPYSAVVTTKLDHNLPKIVGNPAQIRRILENLVTNSLKSLGNEGGHIIVATEYHPNPRSSTATDVPADLGEGPHAILRIQDDGCGMAPGTRTRAFDPFFSSQFGGQGLGLSEVFGMVRNHGGSIVIDSEPDRGTTVSVWLPVGDVQAPSPSAKAITYSEGPVHTDAQKLTVLLVDDEEPIRDAAGEMLAILGYRVIQAVDGDVAVEIYREQHEHIDVVLLDMIMPRMGGEETLREMRKIDPEVHVVIASGYQHGLPVNLEAGQSHIGFLRKPFRLASLSATIEKVLA